MKRPPSVTVGATDLPLPRDSAGMADRSAPSNVASMAHDEYDDSAEKPPARLRADDRSISLLDNRDAKVKKASPSDDAILKESLQVQGSSKTCVTTATTQLKVLCRKFAVLSEKVKQEAKMREDAEKEVRRLNEILQDATNPLITSTRTDAQKEELAGVRDELQRTRDELFHVTQAYDRLRAELEGYHQHPPVQQQHHQQERLADHQVQWDREQTSRIHDTLSCTIAELHDELNAKEVEMESLRASLQREKAKHKEMEQATLCCEAQNREDKDQLSKVTQSLRDMTLSHANELEKLHVAQETIKEERTVKEALQHQISTLHQVNDALQKRCDALVRRLQLNANFISESQGLKTQLTELETQHEALAKQMRDIKQVHYQDVEALKAALYDSQSATQDAEKRVLELQGELTALRVQNNTMSEYMMYGPKRAQPMPSMGSDNHSHYSSPRISPTYGRHQHAPPPPPPPAASTLQHNLSYHPRSQHSSTGQSTHPGASLRPPPAAQSHHPNPAYGSFYPQSTYSHQPVPHHGYTGHSSQIAAHKYTDPAVKKAPPAPEPLHCDTYRPELEHRPAVVVRQYEPENEQPKTTTAHSTPLAMDPSTARPTLDGRSSTVSSTHSRASNASSSGSDHSILRALKSRNKQLQERLQQEADATFQLEEEINMITSSYHTLLHPQGN